MYALSYRSSFSTGYGTADLESIREEAQAHNSENHITVCLFFHRKEFVGILEGSRRAVLRIFAGIQTRATVT